MNKNIEALIAACNELNLKYQSYHATDNLVEVEINNKFYVFANWTTPINKHSDVQICVDKDFFYNYFKNDLRLPFTKAYLNPASEEKWHWYVKFNSVDNIVEDIVENFKFPVVVKRNRGTWGINVFKCQNKEEIKIALSEIYNSNSKHFDYVALAQEYIDLKKEYRVICLDSKVILAYEKISTPWEPGANLSPFHRSGAESKLVNDPNLLKKMEEFVSPLFVKGHLTYSGLDLLVDQKDQFHLIEANSSPGYDFLIDGGYFKECVSIYKSLIQYLINKN